MRSGRKETNARRMKAFLSCSEVIAYGLYNVWERPRAGVDLDQSNRGANAGSARPSRKRRAVLPLIQPFAQLLEGFSEVTHILCDDRPTLFHRRLVAPAELRRWSRRRLVILDFDLSHRGPSNASGLRRNSHGVLGSPALKSQPSAANAAQGGRSRTF